MFRDYAVGFAFSVIIITNVQVSDGLLNIVFTNVVDNAKISGIAVFKQGDPNQAPTANAGSDKTITLPVSSAGLS